ncbi:tyrosine-type recombinase/integrase [Rhizobium leguminosarum]|nr:tyrosine-type recombinase/integrase [Rhizobium leguminosarum]MBY5578665.1 tyrosine-type recombinase/integrase [Rhizobium leguminosarum]
MDPGALRPSLEAFTRRLLSLGHTRLTVSGYEASARHFGQWLQTMKIPAAEIDEDTVRRFARHRCRCPGSRPTDHLSIKYVNRARRFVNFLAECRLAAPLKEKAPRVHDEQVLAFQIWLRRHRGISDRTVRRHGLMVMRLLPALGTDPRRYDAALVRQAILDEGKRSSPAYLKTMTMALRSYLRYLAVQAGDISGMRLEDIDWNEGTLRVRGKGRREIRLPLPQDAGDAVIDYLRHARPPAACDQIFLRTIAPFRPLVSTSVSSIVSLALARAGIDHAPSRGAHLLRHSAATSMLRAGATLDVIGTVLRHRSVDTTAHYAKVDIDMLAQIVQPWPGSASC